VRPPIVTLIVVTLTLGACWRGSASTQPPQPSFIARRNALIELRRSVNALSPRLELAVNRIVGLASEAERDAIRQDLVELEHDVAELSRYAVDARTRGDTSTLLANIERDLEGAALMLVNLRDELRYAKTAAELSALDELSRDNSTDPADARRLVMRRLLDTRPQVDLEPRVNRGGPVSETP
jgi:hypothetical protein